MNSIPETRTYDCILIVKEMANKSDLQLLAYDYLQFLTKLGASNISACSKNDYKLTYSIQKLNNILFLEFSFTIVPKALFDLKRKFKLDELVLRSFLTKRS